VDATGLRDGRRGKVVPGLLLAALVVLGAAPYHARFLALDRAAAEKYFTEFPDEIVPGFGALLRVAESKIPRGSHVAIVAPSLVSYAERTYALHRASYVLSGRVVTRQQSRGVPASADAPDREYIVVYGDRLPEGSWEVIAGSGAGLVARRRR
jgi:hypothetical protein